MRLPSRSSRRSLAVALLLLFIGAIAAPLAHEVEPDPIVGLSIRNERDRISVTVTFPIVALDDAQLPRRADRTLDRDASLPILQAVGRDLASSLELQQGDGRLPPPTVAATVSADDSVVRMTLDYRAQPGLDGLAARLSAYRSGSQMIPLLVEYGRTPGAVRTFRVAGQAERIEFEPALSGAARQFVIRGVRTLLGSGSVVLALIGLFVPRRRAGTLPAAAAALLVGEAATGALVASGSWSASAQVVTASQVFAASALVVIALQSIVSAGSRWVFVLAGVFGLSHGIALGDTFLAEASFAGDHAGAALAVFLLVVALGQAWIIAIVTSAISLLRRQGLGERVATVSVSILVAHTALHVIDERSAQFGGSGMTAADFLIRLVLGWGLVIVAAGIVDSIWLNRPRPLSSVGDGPAEATP